MPILKRNKKSHLEKNMFLDEGVDIQRYDELKYPQLDKITERLIVVSKTQPWWNFTGEAAK